MKSLREFLTETSGPPKIEQLLTEESLGRIWSLFSSSDAILGLITAFRGARGRVIDPEQLLRENRLRNIELRNEIRKAGLGFNKVFGHYIEGQGTEFENEVIEESFLISSSRNGKSDSGQLLGVLKQWAKKYEQEAFIYKPFGTTKAELRDASGVILHTFNKLSMNKWAQMRTELHGGQSFVFEGATFERDISTLLVEYQRWKNEQNEQKDQI